MRVLINLVFLFSPIITYCQLDTLCNGIKFENTLSWEEIKVKAKVERKFIFLDFYTTWCLPCKKMDIEVYSSDQVGRLMNEDFISVKVQMDRTKNDNEYVKLWYKEAEIISRKYKIIAYPTLLFMSPDGEILEKSTGFMSASDFTTLAILTTLPGKAYHDPYDTYDKLIAEYKNGKRDYVNMPYMVETSIEINEKEIAQTIANDYLEYLFNSPEDILYTKENIEFITSKFVIKSNSKVFKLFYPNGRKIDSVMDENGYSKTIVDKVIQREIVDPFIGKLNILSIKSASDEVKKDRWKMLFDSIKMQYNSEYAERNLLDAQSAWFKFKDPNLFVQLFLKRIQKYGIDISDFDQVMKLNGWAYTIFSNSSEKKLIITATIFMENIIKKYPTEDSFIDTYASLLYKIGRKQEGLQWEEKALAIEKGKPADKIDQHDLIFYQNVIERMKKGELIKY